MRGRDAAGGGVGEGGDTVTLSRSLVARRHSLRRRRLAPTDPESVRFALARLADAVLLQAVLDAQDGRHAPASTRTDARAFLTDPHGPWAQSRETWLRLAGRRGR